MKRNVPRSAKSKQLLNIFTSEFEDSTEAAALIQDFLDSNTYSKTFFLRALAVARSTDISWNLRRLAILMLEHQILKLPVDSFAEFDFVLTELKLKPSRSVTRELLKEGYSTTNFRRFIPEFRRKLARLDRVHTPIKGWKTSAEALRDFLDLSRQDCKLSLARYLFTPDEVAEKILMELRVSEGLQDLDPSQPLFVAEEAKHAVDRLPDFEASILKRLCSSNRIYWVSDTTSSEINSLVEYPLSTVVIVIKPPGSDVEFEIKRAGRKGDKALTVVYARDGYGVPPSHRLDGGNMQWLIRHEMRAAAKLNRVYRLAHGAEAPIPNYVSRSTTYSVPLNGHEVQTLAYFTDPAVFEEGYDEMRQAMKESVEAFRAEGYQKLDDLPGDLGLTAQFISIVSPAQSVISGTTSFRLDKLISYLSPDGPQLYFRGGLGKDYTKHEARRFADAVLEEVLGVYKPPNVQYRTHRQYVSAALSVPTNRLRANQAYSSALQEIGKLWGTLMGMRGYTRGESFVARNVGLRSVWDNGQWKVKIIFMDHDAVGIVGSQEEDFYPTDALLGMTLDETYIWGREGSPLGAVGHLRHIYQVSDRVDNEAQQLAKTALLHAYKKTQRRLVSQPELRKLFNEQFVRKIGEWDKLVRGFLRTGDDERMRTKWQHKSRQALSWNEFDFDSHIDAIEKNRAFLERHSFLFNGKT